MRARTVGSARVVVVALVGLLSLLLVACGGSDGGADGAASGVTTAQPGAADGELITSEDGALELAVPEGALPEGVERGDLEVVSIPFEWPSDVADAQLREESYPVRVFGLQPSGTQFVEPIAARVRIPREELNGPIVVWHVSTDGVEAVEFELNADAPSEVVEASFWLDSFSEVFVTTLWIPSEELLSTTTSIDRSEVLVGEEFAASGTVRRASQDREVMVVMKAPDTEGFRYRDFVSDYGAQPGQVSLDTLLEEFEAPYRLRFSSELWTLDGRFEASLSDPVIPRTLRVPEGHRQEGDLYLTGEHRFRCLAPGGFGLHYHASAGLFYSAEPVGASSGLPSIPPGIHVHGEGLEWAEGRCVAAPDDGYDGSSVWAIRELLDQSGIAAAVGAAVAGFAQDPAAGAVGASCAVDGLSTTEWTAAEQAALTTPDARTWPDSVIDKHAEVLEQCAPLRPFYESIFSTFDWEDPQCAAIMTEWVLDAYPWRVQIEQGVLDPSRRAEGQAAFEQAVLQAYADTGCVAASE